jgi:peptide/nickel transport system substrate-binding protein
VREALSLAIDRVTIAQRLVGRLGEATSNILTMPRPFVSPNTRIEFDIDRAASLLDAAGYVRGADGVRLTPDGTRMRMLFVSSVSAQRQKVQAVVKDGWQKIGVETEIRAVDPATFFGNPDNPGALARFSADAVMILMPFTSPFPAGIMRRYYGGERSENWAQKSNNWAASNIHKWRDSEYDRVFDEAVGERDSRRSQALWQQVNDILVESHSVLPVVNRNFVSAAGNGLLGPSPRAFDAETWNIAEWRR